jgi:hypothetical protein
MDLTPIYCNVCHVRGLAPVDQAARSDPYVSRHGYAICTDHAHVTDPKYPSDPPPQPFDRPPR